MAKPAVAQKEDSPPDKLQYLSIPALPDWMSMDWELRGRSGVNTAAIYKSGNTQAYELTRVRGGITVRPTNYFSAYAQFHDLHALNLPLPDTLPNMRDTFDLRQAYFTLQSAPLLFQPGRQELRFGEERLIGISNWTNNSRTFDVLRARLGSPANRLDLFSGSVVKIFPTSFDKPTGGFYLHGAYGTFASLIPNTRLEPFVLFKTSPVKSLQGLSGREILVAPGIRATGHLPAHFDYNVHGTLERGGYVNDTIHAGAGYVMAGYTATGLPWSPHLEPEYDYASGNPDRNPFRVSTFDQFYPSNHNVFGLTDLFGWQNIKQRRLNLDMQPNENWSLLFQGESLHAATTRDSVYNGAAAVVVSPPAGGFRSDDIGSEFDASLRYASRTHLVFEAGVGHWWPGALMTANNHGAAETLTYFQITYLARWSKHGASNSP
jgi:hypothetical protein